MTKEFESPLKPFYKGKAELTESHPMHIAVTSRLDNSEVPEDYQGVYVDSSVARKGNESIYKQIESYIQTFTKDDVRIKNIYLYSNSPGTGKTTTASAILNEFIRRRFLYLASKKRLVPETIGLFLDVNEWQTSYNLASMSNDDETMAKIASDVRRYSEVEMLVIDDVGVRSATESFRSLVHSIINARLTNNKPTIFTSNVRLSNLGAVFDSRLQDRIGDHCVQLNFSGESNRGMR